jgi:hypothetical protein
MFVSFSAFLWLQIYLGGQRTGVLHEENTKEEGQGSCLEFCYLNFIFRSGVYFHLILLEVGRVTFDEIRNLT